MSFMPLYIDIKKQKILLVGGGNVATAKLEKLLFYTQNITLITPTLTKKSEGFVQNYNLNLYKSAYQKGDILPFTVVIVATEKLWLHRTIYEESRGKNILVNSVDRGEYCDFIFPSIVHKGDLTVAFSTNGISPAFTKTIADYFKTHIPDCVEDFLIQMQHLRQTLPKGEARRDYFDGLVKAFFREKFK